MKDGYYAKRNRFCASAVVRVFFGLAFTGLSLPVADGAYALSDGCTIWTGSFLATTNLSSPFKAFSKDEVASIQLTDLNDGLSYFFSFTDSDNGANNFTKSGSVGAGETKTIKLTIPADTTNGQLNIFAPGAGDSFDAVLSCAEAAPAAEESGASTTPAVVAAVSRSQTAVIQQNIGARVATVSGAVAGPGAGSSPRGGATPPEPARNSLSQNRLASLFGETPRPTLHTNDADGALRQLAMMGDFERGIGVPDSARLDAADPTVDGTVEGGASGPDGRAAFATTAPFVVWGHGSYTAVDNDHVSGSSDNRYDGDVWGYNLGLDYRFSDAMIAGLSLGYNDTDLTTTFNDGSYKERAFVVAPYAILRPLENLTVTAEAGYSFGDVDVTRNNDSVTGSTDSEMWYGALAVIYHYRPADTLPLSLSPSVTLLAAGKTVDGFTESDGTVVADARSNTRQISPALEAAYDFQAGSLTLTPFVEAGMTYDFVDELNGDAAAFNLGGGLRLSDAETGLSGSLEGNYVAGRRDYSEYTLAGTLLYGFSLFDEEGRDLGIVSPFLGSNLDEYGNQRFRGGFRYTFRGLVSELSLSHRMAQADDRDGGGGDLTSVMLTLAVPF